MVSDIMKTWDTTKNGERESFEDTKAPAEAGKEEHALSLSPASGSESGAGGVIRALSPCSGLRLCICVLVRTWLRSPGSPHTQGFTLVPWNSCYHTHSPGAQIPKYRELRRVYRK